MVVRTAYKGEIGQSFVRSQGGRLRFVETRGELVSEKEEGKREEVGTLSL